MRDDFVSLPQGTRFLCITSDHSDEQSNR